MEPNCSKAEDSILLCGCGRNLPLVRRRGPEQAKCASGDPMELTVEDLVNGRMRGEEALSWLG
jgi:hypothetical protein